MVLRGFVVFATDTNDIKQTSKASPSESGSTQPIYVVVLNNLLVIHKQREKTSIGGQKCYRIFEVFNILLTRELCRTKKIGVNARYNY